MKIVSAIELDAKMTLVVGEYDNMQETIAMTNVSIARSLKRIADQICGDNEQKILRLKGLLNRQYSDLSGGTYKGTL